jgi:hypothetical protein
MPVELSVKDVRGELLKATGFDGEVGDGDPATLLLGTMFHEVFADLVSHDEARSGMRVLFEASGDGEAARQQLREHAYRALVGPRLSRHQSQLNETTGQLMTFWAAVQRMTDWLADLVGRLRAAQPAALSSWKRLADHFAAEEALACELRAEGWSDSVRLTGTADSIVRSPDGERFCAVELKLGRGRPAVDLGQAALYRLIASRGRSGKAALALLRFSAELEETVIDGAHVAEAEARLLALIGTMAGVVNDAKPPDVTPGPDHADLAARIARAFREYGRTVELVTPAIVGPRFLRFEMKLGKGVPVAGLERVTGEVGIRAGLRTAPMVRVIHGRLYVDAERPDPQVVPFSVVRAGLRRDPRLGSALLPIGVAPSGELVSADLSSPVSAHVLVAGSAGSGKSEWLRMALGGLMVANTPATLRLALIDPKSSAFTDLRGSPWLLSKESFWVPGETRPNGEVIDILECLDDLIEEMERRYRLLGAARADDLASYVSGGAGSMPRLVCFFDEYFAAVAPDRKTKKEIETRIALLAAKGRAAGVHMIIALQQPSREVLKGALDANLSCRVGLRVQRPIESRLLLDSDGAERLTGFGDLLYKAIGDPLRLQAPYLTPAERVKLFAGDTSP